MFDLTGKAALVTGASGGIGGAVRRISRVQSSHAFSNSSATAAQRSTACTVCSGSVVAHSSRSVAK